MVNLLLVMLGGAVGAGLRHGVVTLARPVFPDLPMGTLVVNLAGCAAIGLCAGWLVSQPAPREPWRLLVMVGVLGGFTTFSSFALELVELTRRGDWPVALAYAGISNVIGLLLAAGGFAVASRLSAG